MVNDAEKYAEEDRQAAEGAKAYNDLDNIVYALENSLTSATKLEDSAKKEIESVISDAKAALQSRDITQMSTAKEKLTQIMNQYASQIYSQPGAEGSSDTQEAQKPPEQESATPNTENNKPKEKVVEAEYEEVDDEKSK